MNNEFNFFESIDDIKKIKDIKKSDFLKLLIYCNNNLEHFSLDKLKKVDNLLNYYYEAFKEYDLDYETDSDFYYYLLRNSKIYKMYEEYKIKIAYPKVEDSLYKLELEFIEIIKKEQIDTYEYNKLLKKIYYLKDCLTEKTSYILHNILLYYKDIESIKRTCENNKVLYKDLKEIEFQLNK